MVLNKYSMYCNFNIGIKLDNIVAGNCQLKFIKEFKVIFFIFLIACREKKVF